MILQTQAKPIRFRIKSADIEHASLDSLRTSYSIEDIKKIPIKNILKWLDLQNESDIREKIKEYAESSSDDIFELTRILFNCSEQDNVHDTISLLLFWERNGFVENIQRLIKSTPLKELCLICDHVEIRASNLVRSELSNQLFIQKQIHLSAELGNIQAESYLKRKSSNNQHTTHQRKNSPEKKEVLGQISLAIKKLEIRQPLYEADLIKRLVSQIVNTTNVDCNPIVTFIRMSYERYSGYMENIPSNYQYYHQLMCVRECDWNSFLDALHFIQEKMYRI